MAQIALVEAIINIIHSSKIPVFNKKYLLSSVIIDIDKDNDNKLSALIIGNDYQSLPTLNEIPSLSLEDFKQSMGISLSNSPENNSQDTIPEFSKGNIIDPDDFFKARAPENTDSDFAGRYI